MMLQEYFTEEPWDLSGIDIPCHTGEYMDVRDNDVSTFGDPDEAESYHYYLCPIVEKIEKGKSVCDVDKLVH